MPLEVRETRLPGVGFKYSLGLAQGRISVILHMDGQREIYYYRRRHDDEPTAVIELHDDEARQLGAILGGAYERPKIVEELTLMSSMRGPAPSIKRSPSRTPMFGCRA